MTSLIFNTDSYKLSHWVQYPPGTQRVSSYIEARGVNKNGIFNFVEGDVEVVNYGITAFIKEALSTFPTWADLRIARELIEGHGFTFNTGWEDLVNECGGPIPRLPLIIEALPEGTVVSPGTVQVQVHNTDPRFYWFTSYLETMMLRSVWYGSTVATLSREIKKIIKKKLDVTFDGPSDDVLIWKLHDFGARGATSTDASVLGGSAHLINFRGSDTVAAIDYIMRNFDTTGMTVGDIAMSVPAAEHSTITSWGRDREVDAYANMINTFGKPGALISVVSDSYDIYNAVDNIWGVELKQKVLDSGATLVVRPDSGDPVTVANRVLDILSERFGFTVNTKGYKVLHPSVRVIWGDGLDPIKIRDILDSMIANGFCVSNITFGMGGGLLQKVNRDDLAYAMKMNAIDFGNGWEDVYKMPKSDPRKESKAGRRMVTFNNGVWNSPVDNGDEASNMLEIVYDESLNTGYNGTWSDIRRRAAL